MNPGIYDLAWQYATVPRGLLGLPSPVPVIDHRVFSDPRAINGCTAWFDATDRASFTMNGSRISEWRSRVPNSTAYSQTTAASQPSMSTLNGLAAIDFTASTLFSSGPSLSQLADTTSNVIVVFFVLRAVGASGNGRFFGTVSSSPSLSGFGFYPLLFNGIAYWDAPETSARVNAAPRSTVTTTSNIFRLIRNGGVASMNQNGFLLASRSNASGAVGPNLTESTQLRGVVAVGTSSTLLGEMIVYSRALSSVEIDTVERYLREKWGVP